MKMKDNVRKILQERLDEDEHDWKPLNTICAVEGIPILSWIRGYFSNDEGKEIERFEIRSEKLEPPFAKQILELRNPERNRGYVFFVGRERTHERTHNISKGLVKKRYVGMLRYIQKYFIDLKEDLSGFYWETNLDLKGKGVLNENG